MKHTKRRGLIATILLALLLPLNHAQAGYVAATWSDTAVHLMYENLSDAGSFSAGASDPNGIATDGTLIYTGHFNTEEVVAYNFSGVEQFRWSGTLSGLQGMELVNGELAIYRGGNIEFFNPATGAFIRSIAGQSSTEGIAFDGTLLWMLVSTNIVGVNPANGNVVSTIPNAADSCNYDGTGITSVVPGELVLGCENGNWYRVSSTNGNVLDSGNNGLNMYGLKYFAECGNDTVDASEICDDGNNVNGDGCSADCMSDETCGNSVVDASVGEECDDGGTVSGDGCNATCQLEYCGNGTVDASEVCDDGNAADGDGCSHDCMSNETCGNGIVDGAVGEACDDGNNTDGDGCQADCALPTCGDGVVDTGEVCDDGNNTDGDGCNATCTSDESCGNGVVDGGEQCDDGNNTDGDGCSATCQLELEYCGDGTMDTGEVCDDGNNMGGDGCSADCQSTETCGNSITDWAAGETCDDGNTAGGDGCSATCEDETSGGSSSSDGGCGCRMDSSPTESGAGVLLLLLLLCGIALTRRRRSG